MKKGLFISVAAVALLGVSLAGQSFTASAEAIPSPAATITAEDGYTYNYYDFTYNSNKQKLHTIESKPSDSACNYEFVLHHISNGSGGYTLTKVLDIAKDYEAETGRKVIAATNGDFFVNSSGYKPVESYVVDGTVLQQTTNVSGNYATKNSFGWDNEGNVVTGKMSELTTMLTVTPKNGDAKTFEIEKTNAEPSDGCIAIYNRAGTYNNVKDAAKYVINADGTSSRTAQGSVIDDKSFSVKTGQFAIVVKGENEISQWMYDNVYYGATAELVDRPGGKFLGMQYVIGGWNVLVDRGVAKTDCGHGSQTDAASNADRTFFGIKQDGTMMLCALDGRQSGHSVGMSVNSEAQLAKDLGLYTAIELDGGGSTTFVLRQNDELTVVNQSSEVAATGACRAVLNAVLLVEKEEENEPTEPDDPTGPDDPAKPDDPADPDGSGETDPPGDKKPDDGGGANVGLIAGICAGGVALVAIVGVAIAVIKKKGAK